MTNFEFVHLSLEIVKGQIDELDENILDLTRKRAALVILVNFLEEFPDFNTECDNA